MHYRHHHRHGKHEQKKWSWHCTFVIAIPVSSQNIELRHLRGSLYKQDRTGALCLDFVKLLHKCLDYDLGQHIYQPQQGLIIFYAFRVIFTSAGLFLHCKTHPEGHTNKPKVPLQHNMLLIKVITSSGLSQPIVSRTVI